MALWIDRHRPNKLNELTIQPQANQILDKISKSFAFPHLLLSGPPGSGKKTRVMAFLRALFQKDIDITKMRSEFRNIEISTSSKDKKNLEVQVTSSQFHVEITPADYGNNDRHVISFFLKEIAASQSVSDVPIKVVIINDAHRLTKLAQQALRRTMEKYAKTCRIILICDSLSQVIEPVRSRCLIIRTPRVPDDDVAVVISEVAAAEKFDISQNILNSLVQEAHGDLRRAINLLEILSMHKKDSDVATIIPEWERYINELVKILIENDITPDVMKKIRNHLYELRIHNIPATAIFQTMLRQLLDKVDYQLIPKITDAAATYEARMHMGNKPIFHLEAFAARFICIHKDYLSDMD